jgi:multidrug efflux pump subunit AcrA (membrane-fusion protein)
MLLTGGFIVVLAGLVVWSALGERLPVGLQHVISLVPSTVLPARIEPADTWTIYSEFPARVASVQVAPGQQVQVGQLVAVLENDDLVIDLDHSRRRLARAEAKIPSGARTPGPVDKEQLRLATKSLEAARARLEAYSLADAENVWKRSRDRLAQVRSLFEQHLATNAELEDWQARELGEARNLQAAQEHLSRLRQEVELAESQLNIQQMAQTTTTAAAADGDELESARAAVAAAQARLDRLRVVAPRTAAILEVPMHAGDSIPAGSLLIRGADLANLNFDVPVAASIALRIAPDTPVVVRVPSEPPMRIRARVSSVLLVPNQAAQSYRVRVTIPNPTPGTVLAGLEGAVEFPHLER